METEKIKQYVAMLGGALGGIYLFLKSLELEFKHFNEVTIESFMTMLTLVIPFIFVLYGVYKNQYLITRKARKLEEEQIKRRLK